MRGHPGYRWVAVLIGVLLACPTRAGELKPGATLQVDGDHFTYTDGSANAPIKGVLVKPSGKGPFPAILISHGLGGNAEQFGLPKCREFAKRGFVCIAPNYTHADRNGDRSTYGASPENLRRAKACLDALESLPTVDPKRLYAYGNSMGAFLTIGLAADQPDRLAAAAITAGGVVPVPGNPAPSREQAGRIKTPFCILHGSADTTVPPERSALLADVLKEHKVPVERDVYDGVNHNLHAVRAAEVNARIEAWFRKHGAGATPS